MPNTDAHRAEVDALLAALPGWARGRADVVAVGLVGSWAREAARPDSDVDLIVLTTDTGRYAAGDGSSGLGALTPTATRQWGPVTERRFVSPSGLQVELGFAPPAWAATDPVDAGTARVVGDGLRPLYDPGGVLVALGATTGTGVHVTTWDDGAPAGERAVFVHGSTTWGTSAFARQRPLATSCRLDVVDRRGYGASPDVDRSDALLDAADVAALLDEPAHLVGHSFGTVVVMLAAAARPDRVRSIALIEPSAYRAVAADPAVAVALDRNRAAAGGAPDLTAAEYLRMSSESVGLPPLEPTPARLRAAATAMRERPCWDVDLDLDRLPRVPATVVNGSWETAPALYREVGGEPLLACGRATAGRLGAEHLSVTGAAHEPHWDQPEVLNAALLALWSSRDPEARA